MVFHGVKDVVASKPFTNGVLLAGHHNETVGIPGHESIHHVVKQWQLSFKMIECHVDVTSKV